MSRQYRNANVPKYKYPPLKAAARNFEHPFKCGTGKRGHVKEVGDPTIFPCGSIVFHDEHYRKCNECDAHRIIMDSWQTFYEHNKHHDPPPPPKDLTMAGVKTVLREMGATIDDVRRTGFGWNPFCAIDIYDDLTGSRVPTQHSFYVTYRNLPANTKKRMLRPELPYPFRAIVTKESAASVPILHRAHNIKREALEYLVGCAQTDGILPKEYVDAVLADYGIVPKQHQSNDGTETNDGNDPSVEEHYSTTAGIDIGNMYNEIWEGVKDPNILDHMLFSPRANGSQEPCKYMAPNERLKLWKQHQKVYGYPNPHGNNSSDDEDESHQNITTNSFGASGVHWV